MHPLSPALSACDSLVGIEDLDSFLASKGALSHWPTPPSRSMVESQSFSDSDTDDDGDDCEHSLGKCCRPISTHQDIDYGMAAVLVREATEDMYSPYDIGLVRDLLWRAGLQDVVIAIALNIVLAWRAAGNASNSSAASPVPLTVIGALRLAVSYTSDDSPTSGWWSRRVSRSRWTTQQVEASAIGLLAGLSWTIHAHTSPTRISAGLKLLGQGAVSGPGMVDVEDHCMDLALPNTTATRPLSLGKACQDAKTCPAAGAWQNAKAMSGDVTVLELCGGVE